MIPYGPMHRDGVREATKKYRVDVQGAQKRSRERFYVQKAETWKDSSESIRADSRLGPSICESRMREEIDDYLFMLMYAWS